MERRLHSPADRFVPGTIVIFDVDAGVLVPEREFGQMGARVVAAGYEGRLLVLNRLKRLRDVFHTFDAGGVALWPN
jgi:hypothetical protein